MTVWQKFTQLNKHIKRFFYTGLAVLFYAITGFFILPLILKPIIVDTLTEKLDRPTQLEEIKFNPFTLSVSLKGLAIDGKHTDKLLGFDLLTVNFQALPLVQKTIAFDEILINKPEVSLVVLPNGEYNFQDIIDNNTSPTEPEPENTNTAWVLAINKFRHNAGIVNYSDKNRETIYHHQINEINVALDNFETTPGKNNTHEISAKTSKGTELNLLGNFSLSPIKASGDIQLISKLHAISDYLQEKALFNISDGTFKLNSHYDFDLINEDPQYTINNLIASISALEILRHEDNKKMITFEELNIDLEQLNSSNKKILINSITNKGSFVAINKDKLNKLDIQDLFTLQNNESVTSNSAVTSAQNSIENNDNTITPPPEGESENWDLTINTISTNNSNIVFSDSAVSPSAIQDVIINAFTIENLKPFTNEVALLSSNIELNKQGIIKINGTIKPNTKKISLTLDTEQIPLKNLQPYVNTLANVQILDGALATKLAININAEKATPLFDVNGDITISSLDIIETQLKEKLVSWESFTLNEMNFSYPDQKFSLKAINIKAPSLRLIINEDSTTNIQQLIISYPANTAASEVESAKVETETAPDPTQQDFTATINKINIINAELDFSDRSLIPGFSAGIYNLSGDIAGLSSNNDSRAKINLEGKIDKYAPVIIKGLVNPLSHDVFTDIDMLFNGIELTTFTPYSGKFAGYKIDKGKLSLALNYKLHENKLVAENKVKLDQFTLGKAVESEDATSLPINFALSLLKDADGVIDFDLPIRGDIDNPDFRYSSLVWGALGNLITGIVSSPFKALGSLIDGDSDNLDYVAFTENSAEINEAEKNKLNSLAKALLQRPSLYIEIRGLSSHFLDHDAMAYTKILKQLQLTPRGLSDALSEDDKTILVTYSDSLKEPTTESAELKDVSLNEQKDAVKLTEQEKILAKEKVFKNAVKFMLNKTQISENEYLTLAKQRALQIQTYLIETAKVPSINLFLLDSKIELENENDNIDGTTIKIPLNLKAK